MERLKHGIKEPEVIRSGSDKGSLEEFNVESITGSPGIEELSVKPATFQCKVISNEKSLQAPAQVTESLNPRVLIQSSQSMAEIEEQPTNGRTWKQSTIEVVPSEFSHKHMHVSQEVQYSNKPVVEVVEQPRQEP